jgi:hypothetical protein
MQETCFWKLERIETDCVERSGELKEFQEAGLAITDLID